jgi:hypothetical protein
MNIVEFEPSSRYERETYNILYVGKFHHRVKGAKHNPRALFSVRVWDNTARPNDCPEGRWTDFGKYGGPGQYLGPDNLGTDQPLSVTMNAEAVVISAQPFARKGEGDTLAIGEVVTLNIPGGSLGTWQLDQKALHDPHMFYVP